MFHCMEKINKEVLNKRKKIHTEFDFHIKYGFFLMKFKKKILVPD